MTQHHPLHRSHHRSTAWIYLVTIAALSLGASTCLGQQVERDLSANGTWSIVDAPELNTPAGELHLARQALAQKRYSDARRRMDAWIKAHPGDPLEPEAYLIRADAQFMAKEYYKSLYDYEFICRTYPGSEAFMIALEREFEVAKLFASGVRRKLWGIRWIRAYDEAEELFIRIQERAPGSKLAERAGRALADHYYNLRDMDLAATMYDIYIKNNPKAADNADAMQRLVYSYLATYKGPAFDVSGLNEADGWLNILRAKYPAEAQQMRAEALQQRIEEARAQKMLVDADFYLKRNDDVSAKFMLNRLLRKHPTTQAAKRAYKAMKDRGWVSDDVPDELKAEDAPAILDQDKDTKETPETGDGETPDQAPTAAPVEKQP